MLCNPLPLVTPTDTLSISFSFILIRRLTQDWFSRQQLVMLVLIVNIALGIMFFKMLT